MGWEGGSGRRRHVYMWLIHVLWQKPTQYCKAIIPQWNKQTHKKRIAGQEEFRPWKTPNLFSLKGSFPGGISGKEPACQCKRCKRRRFNPWAGKIPWRRTWQPTPVFLPGESHGQGSLVGYSPWGHKELGMAESTSHTCTCLYGTIKLITTDGILQRIQLFSNT